MNVAGIDESRMSAVFKGVNRKALTQFVHTKYEERTAALWAELSRDLVNGYKMSISFDECVAYLQWHVTGRSRFSARAGAPT